MQAVKAEHRRYRETAAADPDAIEAALRREARDVYGWSNAPGDTYGEHEHGYTKVLYCTRGSIEFVLADGRVSMRLGDRLILPQRTRHSALVGPDGCTCIEGTLPP